MKKIIVCVLLLFLYESLKGMEGQQESKEDRVLEQPTKGAESMLESWAIVNTEDDSTKAQTSVGPLIATKEIASGYSSDGGKKPTRKHQTLNPNMKRHRARTRTIVKPKPLPQLKRQHHSLDLMGEIFSPFAQDNKRQLQRTSSSSEKAKEHAEWIELISENTISETRKQQLKVLLLCRFHFQEFCRHNGQTGVDGNYINRKRKDDSKNIVDNLGLVYHSRAMAHYNKQSHGYFDIGNAMDKENVPNQSQKEQQEKEQIKYYIYARSKARKTQKHIEKALEIYPADDLKEKDRENNEFLETLKRKISISTACQQSLEHWQLALNAEQAAKRALETAQLFKPQIAKKSYKNIGQEVKKGNTLQDILDKKRKKLDRLNKKAEAIKSSKNKLTMVDEIDIEDKYEKAVIRSIRHHLEAIKEFTISFNYINNGACIQKASQHIATINELERKIKKASGAPIDDDLIALKRERLAELKLCKIQYKELVEMGESDDSGNDTSSDSEE